MVVAEESRESRVGEAVRFLNVVCAGMVISVGVFVMVAWFVASGLDSMGPLGPPLPQGVVYFGVAVGLALLVAAPIAHRKMLERAAQTVRAHERTDTTLESFRLATLLSFILREGAAIVGLMLTLLTSQPMWCYLLAAAAIVAMITGWPREEHLRALMAGDAAA
jgi:hypothetical protein